MNTTLFRNEIAEHQQQRLMGVVSLAQPVSIYVWCLSLLLLFVLVSAFLLLSEHHRKERIQGYLVPDKGLLRIHSSHGATVGKIHVSEGERVQPGDLLVSLVRNQTFVGGSNLEVIVIAQLEQRLGLVEESIVDNQRLLEKKLLASEERLQALDREAAHLNQQLQLAHERISIKKRRLKAARLLHGKGYFSAIQLDQTEEAFLAEKFSLGQLQQLVLSHIQFNIKSNELQRRASEFIQQLVEVRASFQPEIRAVESGFITAIAAVEGQLVQPGQPVMTLIPEGSTLIAELLLPSRSAGQIKRGDFARLRFDAFPYQKFGMMDAEILQVDRALKEQDAGAPLPNREPVYRVRALLTRQNIESFQLRSGMLVEADIMLEKRSLLDWMLAPVTGLKERLG
jgi:membrane fusion protein